MELLVAEDEKAPLIGRTFRIKAIGNGTSRDWQVKEIASGGFKKIR